MRSKMLIFQLKKTCCVLAAAGIMTNVLNALQQYIETRLLDHNMVITIMLIIMIDTILGIFIAYKTKSLSSSGFAKMFTKVSVYMLVLTATHLAATGIPNNIFLNSFDSYVYSIVCARELLSIFEKSAILGVINIPDSIADKFEVFREILKKKETINQ